MAKMRAIAALGLDGGMHHTKVVQNIKKQASIINIRKKHNQLYKPYM